MVDDQLGILDDAAERRVLARRPEHEHLQHVRRGLLAQAVEQAAHTVGDARASVAVRLTGPVDAEPDLLVVG